MVKNRKNAFTLVELLVVIAIIAMLLSILMPALSRVRAAGKQVVCQSQQKQWGLATMLYATDNKDALPYFGLAISNNASVNENLWFSKLAPYISGKAQVTASYNTKLRKCPAGRPASKSDYATTAFGIDNTWIGWIGTVFADSYSDGPFFYTYDWQGNLQPPLKVTKISRPSEFILFIDVYSFYMYTPVGVQPFSYDYDKDGKADSSGYAYFTEGLPYSRALPKTHSGGCNVTMADGRSEYVKYKKLWDVKKDNSGRWMPTHPYWRKP